MSAIRKVLLIVFVLIPNLVVFAQEASSFNFSDSYQQLPDDNVYCVVEDSQQNLWFGTENGPARFDGFQIETFEAQHLMAGSDVFNIFEDSKGRLWFQNFQGVVGWYDGGEFHSPLVNGIETELVLPGYLSTFFEDSQAGIWWGTSLAEVIHLSPTGELLERKSLRENPVAVADIRESKGIIEVYASGWYRFEKGIWNEPTWTEKLVPSRIFDLPDGRTLASKGNQLFQMEADGLVPLTINESGLVKGEIIYMGMDAKGTFWLGTRNGAFAFPDADIQPSNARAYFSGSHISGVCLDFEQNLWFATDNGVLFLDRLAALELPTPENLRNHAAMAIGQLQDGKILCGFRDGELVEIDTVSLDYSVILPANGRSFHTNYYDFIPKNEDSILIVWDSRHEASLPPSFFGAVAKWSRKGPDGRLWTEKYHQLVNFRLPVNFRRKDYRICLQTAGRVTAFQYSRDGRYLFFGDSKGFHMHDSDEASQFKHLQSLDLGGVEITSLLEDAKGRIWIATKGKGLLQLSENGLVRLGKEDGLLSDYCGELGLVGDRIVLTSAEGFNLIRANAPDKQILGFPIGPVNDVHTVRDQIWLACRTGLRIFTLASITTPIPAPDIGVRKMVVNEIEREDLQNLDYLENNISILLYAKTHYLAKGMQFQYRIPGIDSSWKSSPTHELVFPDFRSGKQSLEIRAQFSNGLWSRNTLEIPIHIRKPLWQKAGFWFAVSYLLLCVAVLAAFLRWRILRRQLETKKQLLELEGKAMRAQLNPHFVSNALSAIQNFFLTGEKLKGNMYLSEFSQLIRRYLEQSEKQWLVLDEEVKTLRLYLEIESLRLDHPLDFSIDFGGELRPSAVMIPCMMIQPLVENAVWHGVSQLEGHGEIGIQFEAEGNRLRCTITDNGPGKVNGGEKSSTQSMATRIIRERLEILGNQFRLELELNISLLESGGTRVIIYLPYYEEPIATQQIESAHRG